MKAGDAPLEKCVPVFNSTNSESFVCSVRLSYRDAPQGVAPIQLKFTIEVHDWYATPQNVYRLPLGGPQTIDTLNWIVKGPPQFAGIYTGTLDG
jgi:hypothetical protein